MGRGSLIFMKKLSFVIPCYNSQNTIGQVVDEIIETVGTRNEYDYEIILVNDSSPDDVFKTITKLAEKNKRIKGIDLARNFGQHSAIMAGFNYVTGDIVVCLDDDGQTPASEMFSLIDKLDENDLVFAKYKDKKHSAFRNMGSKINDKMAQWLIGKPKKLKIMSYFACKRFVIDEVVRYKNSYPYISGLLLRVTNKVDNVEVNHRERIEGSSGYTIKKLFLLWINGFTAFSVKPLRIATFIGCITAIIGFIYGLTVVINKLVNPLAPIGYSSMMSVLLFVGGMIMLLLGMIGEYVGRTYISLNDAPQYVVRTALNVEECENEEE